MIDPIGFHNKTSPQLYAIPARANSAASRIARETPPARPGAPIKTIRIGEWKKFGDLKLFTKVDSTQGGQKLSIVYELIEFNTVDESMFEVPAGLGGAADPLPKPAGPTSNPAGKPSGKGAGGTGSSGGSR